MGLTDYLKNKFPIRYFFGEKLKLFKEPRSLEEAEREALEYTRNGFMALRGGTRKSIDQIAEENAEEKERVINALTKSLEDQKRNLGEYLLVV